MRVERFYDSSAEFPVKGYLHVPDKAAGSGMVLSHGAGSNCTAPLLVALAGKICEAGMTVLRVDLQFRLARPSGPPPRGSAERDQAGLLEAVAALRRLVPGRIFLGGHSYGGRQASMLAAREANAAHGLLLLSYPLHPPERPEQMRTEHFARIQTPALFVHGTLDPFATSDELHAAIQVIPAATRLLEIKGGRHDLATTKNREAICAEIAAALEGFFAS